MDFANTVINAAAGQTAIWHKLRGINSTIASGSASGLAALGYASDLIRYGEQAAVLAGGVDEFSFESFYGFECAGMLQACDVPGPFPVPFHAARTGFAVGEAAGLLMLEEWKSAEARGARILGEVRGHCSTYSPDKSQEQTVRSIVRAMAEALKDARMSPAEIGCISASANGSVRADLDEAIAINSLLNGNGPVVPITAIKSMLGETLGASGSLQAIDLVETLRSRIVPGIRGLEEEKDRSLPDLNFCREQSRIHGNSGLINSIGLDGVACSLLISAPSAQA
jgi:3-oxoacyl-[acyl-carrier-protein] synthase II